MKSCRCGKPFKTRNDARQNKCAACRSAAVADYYRRNPWMRSCVSARTRCVCKSDASYKRYGGAGIKFLMTGQDFKALWERDKADLMTSPTIDRIDPKGHYEISNCRFIEHRENSRRASRLRSKCQVYHPGVESEYVFRTDGAKACRLCRIEYSKQYWSKFSQNYPRAPRLAKQKIREMYL